MSGPIRIFIVDDHPLVREWLGNLLRLQPDLEVCGEADEAAAAAAGIERVRPDIAVVDLSLKRGYGLDLIKDLRTRCPATQVIVFSMHEEVTDVVRALRAGARGYVMKRESSGQIVAAIRQVRAGQIYAHADVLMQLAERMVGRPDADPNTSPETLSDRELEVFKRLGEGQTTRRIADDLGVSLKTVQTYCARIKEKLGLGDGAELVREALRWSEGKRP